VSVFDCDVADESCDVVEPADDASVPLAVEPAIEALGIFTNTE
jgi:hypothetical protein